MGKSFEEVLPFLRVGAVVVSCGKRYKLVNQSPGEEKVGDKIIRRKQIALAQLADDGSDKILAHVTLSAEQIIFSPWTVESYQVEPLKIEIGAISYTAGKALL